MKARLRTVLFSTLFASAAFTSVTYTSCTEDKCKAILCAYNGVCNEGACLCPAGYEGPQCETINRERFKGIWQVEEDGTRSNAAQYPVSIDDGSDITHVTIKNFRNALQDLVNCSVKGDTLYIPLQTVNAHKIQGFGVLQRDIYYAEHGTLTMFYSVTDPIDSVDNFGLPNGKPSVWHK